MFTYVGLLRGINVGGHRMIKMADLAQMLTAMGADQVKTYIQSGNVLFRSDEEAGTLRTRIEQQIEATFGFPVTTVLRTLPEFERIVQASPFQPEHLTAGESLYVAFLGETPRQAAVDKVLALPSGGDECRLQGQEAYLLLRQSVRSSALMNRFEKALGVPATTRNWQTTLKLLQMGRDLEG